MKIAMRLLNAVHFRRLNARGHAVYGSEGIAAAQRIRRLYESFRVVSVSMGQGLGLASISEARASACVSIYSRTFVNLPFRTNLVR
jgi:hypothetical protein